MKENAKKQVKKELAELKEHAKQYSFNDIKTGNWFTNFLTYALKNYSKKVDAEFFRNKYPNVPIEGVVRKRIKIAQKYAAIEGALSASLYSGAVAMTIGSHGGASPITGSAAVTSFVADMLYTTNLQLKLAYDLSVLYKRDIDIEDPEDVTDLFKVAFGVKIGEKFSDATSKIAPEVVRVGIKKIITGSRLTWLKSLPVIGKYLLQRNIIKFSIPLICIPLNSGANYFYTGRVAKTAKKIYKDRAIITEKSKDIIDELDNDFLIFLEVVWIVIAADGKFLNAEIDFINDLANQIQDKSNENVLNGLKTFSERVDISPQNVIEKLKTLDKESQIVIYEAACTAAAIDKKIDSKEVEILKLISNACELTFNEKHIKSKALVLY